MKIWTNLQKQSSFPLPSKTEAIESFPRPKTKSLQKFLGMVNCYHRVIPIAAQIMGPVYDTIFYFYIIKLI